MLRNPASRVLATSRRALHVSTSTHPTRRAHGSLSHLWSNAHQMFVSNRNERNSNRSYAGIPRISLAEHQRSFFSTSLTEGPASDHTFRERMEERKEQGREVASAGAHSLGEMFRRYGAVFGGTYFTVYFSTLGLFFLGIESGALDPAYIMSWVSSEPDAKSTVQVVIEFMDHYPWTRPYVPMVESNPEVANLAVAWIAVKFTEPIRFGTTVAIVPRLARYLGYAPPKDDSSPDDSEDATVENKEEQSKSKSESVADAEGTKGSKN
jgi:hypothetical protein